MIRAVSRAAALCAVVTWAQGADLMHVPLLCKYHQESHFVAGALVGLAMNAWMDTARPDEAIPVFGRFVFATAVAAGIGAGKEYLIDRHPRSKEIPPWALGAAVVTLCWTVRW